MDNLFAMTAQHSYDFNDTVDFDRMFRDIIAELTPRIREKNLEINLHHSGFHITANSVMLTRAFSNLVENAVKYNIEAAELIFQQSLRTSGMLSRLQIMVSVSLLKNWRTFSSLSTAQMNPGRGRKGQPWVSDSF